MGREDIIETEIPVSQLAIGMHVIRLDRPWEDTDFLLQGFILQTEEDVLAVPPVRHLPQDVVRLLLLLPLWALQHARMWRNRRLGWGRSRCWADSP